MTTRSRLAFSLVTLALLGAGPPPRATLTGLSIHPPSATLTGPRAEARLGVLGTYADGSVRDLSRAVSWRSSRPKAVTVSADGVARPAGDGRAVVTAEHEGQQVSATVRVKGMADEDAVGFTREVVPVLTRAGCNSGACHGAQHGKGGFRLSLLGFDSAFDYAQIVQSAEGRRVVPSEPERSILLQKPAGVMDHLGGERFKVGSRPYELLRAWLEDGAPGPGRAEPAVTALEAWPGKRRMRPGEQQQVIVRATWSDGLVSDVTALAQFDAVNESVAAVTPEGLITAKAAGESHVMVRFAGQARVVQITLPYGPAKGEKLPRHNFIDDKLAAKWRELGLAPSPVCDDEVFLRRLYLDAIGTLPTPAEIKAFVADGRADKRTRAIDHVLDRPELVDYWALKWGDLLRINRDLLQEKGMWSFHNWVRASLRDGKALDAMAREIVTAQGSTFTDGPANFFQAARNPADWAETTAQLFLGVRLGCAKCHTHPFEKWTQDDYWGMAAFFARVGTKTSQEFGLFGRETVIFLRDQGEVTHPRKGGVVAARPLGAAAVAGAGDRRNELARWLTAKDNPFFARNLANRFWAYTMGRGLVEPIDDLRETNPPSVPELLDALAEDLIRNKYDLKHLLRTIFRSRAYQLSSDVSPGNRADASNVYYARYARKRLTAEQLADAIDFATGTREKYQGLPLGTRAIQLPDTRVRSFLLDVFGRPPRQVTCECERTASPNIAQALHLLNGDFLNGKIESPTGRVAALLAGKKSAAEVVEELYLVTLSRSPSKAELARDVAWLGKAASRREGAQDLLWVLLNRREYQFVR